MSQRLSLQAVSCWQSFPSRVWHSLWLAGLVNIAGLGWFAAATQPVDVADIAVTRAIAPLPLSLTVHDPEPFLPVASQQISLLVLKLSERRLYGYQGDRLVATYPVAVGRDEWETPTGEFTVFQRQQHPAWEHPFTGEIVPPGSDNPLGARWIGFWTDGVNAIGFHGTPDGHLIGQAVSHGCVRLHDADVIELYGRVRLGTRVIVQP
ncbi:MAG: L,D-transpeptidase [Cyanobacteria bacterium P01_C01_bin.70]